MLLLGDNIMAKAFVRLVERDVDGVEVAAYSLGGGAQTITWNTNASLTGDLKWFHMGSEFHNNVTDTYFHVGITFFVSTVLGRINLAETDIDPRMLESVIRISNYTYANSSNHLSLRIAAVHDTTSYSASGDSVSTGQDLKELYVKLASKCHVVENATALVGVVQPVIISQWFVDTAVKSLVALSDAAAYLTQKFGANWDVRIASIQFPAGATHIVYDPTLGAGSTKATTSAASAIAVPSALVLFAGAIAALFF